MRLLRLLKDSEVHHGCELSDADLSLFSKVEYVGIQCRPFDENSGEWTVKLVNKASNLQQIIPNQYSFPTPVSRVRTLMVILLLTEPICNLRTSGCPIVTLTPTEPHLTQYQSG